MWKLFDKFGAQKQSLGGIANYGWDIIQATLTYSSTDDHIFVCTTDIDLTGIVPLGSRVRLTHAAATKYFIVVAVASGSITLYGGTDYTLAAGAITNPLFSISKAPIGFPLNPVKWTEILVDSTNRSQASPSTATWYNIGSLLLAIPIGAWDVVFQGVFGANKNSATMADVYCSLSTSSSSESDSEFTSYHYASETGASSQDIQGSFHRRKTLFLAAKTTYYVIAKTAQTSEAGIGLYSQNGSLAIRAICAYL